MKASNYVSSKNSYQSVSGCFDKLYEFLGSGCFGRVYQKTPNTVIKIGRTNTDGYFQYIKHIGLNNKNIHAPRIHRISLYEYNPNDSCNKNNFYILEMEKLISWDSLRIFMQNFNGDKFYNKFITNYFKSLGFPDTLLEEAPYCLSYNHLPNCENLSPHMSKMRTLLLKLYKKYRCDIACSNVMWRDTGNKNYQLVITDPIV